MSHRRTSRSSSVPVMWPVVLALPGMDAVEYTPNLRYPADDDPSLLLDIYRPPGASPGERLPAVLFIHGGTDTRARAKDWGVFQSWERPAFTSGAGVGSADAPPGASRESGAVPPVDPSFHPCGRNAP